MKTISGPFLTMLQTSQQLVKADLYTITLSSGTVFRYTSAQNSIVYSGNTYLGAYLDNVPSFVRGATKTSIGLNTDDLEIDIYYDTATLINNLTPGQFANLGGFDNAVLQVDVALAPDWSNPVVNGVVNLFTGLVAEVEADASIVRLKVNSRLRALNTAYPRNYVLPMCNHALFDTGCTLNKATYAVSGTVSGTPTNTSFNTNLAQADGYFALGYVVWLTGANAGEISFVKSYLNASGNVTVLYPLSPIPSAGDTFTAYPGCDKLEATCNTKYSNLAHFRGFPFCPTPETLNLGSSGGSPEQVGGGGNFSSGPGGQQGNFQLQ